jgi:hypothetical protein
VRTIERRRRVHVLRPRTRWFSHRRDPASGRQLGLVVRVGSGTGGGRGVNGPSDEDVGAFRERLQAVRERIAAAAERAGRSPADVGLIGVTKTHAPEVAATAVAAGLVDLGENRVQELLAKQPLVAGARWHLIGPLQRNKVRQVVGRSILLHTLDRPALADALSQRAAALGVVQRVLVQVNVGADPAKAGCDLTETGGAGRLRS